MLYMHFACFVYKIHRMHVLFIRNLMNGSTETREFVSL